MVSKSWAIKLATEAARTVLSVDQIIVARQAGGPKPPGPNPVSRGALFRGIESLLTITELGRRLDVLDRGAGTCIIPMSSYIRSIAASRGEVPALARSRSRLRLFRSLISKSIKLETKPCKIVTCLLLGSNQLVSACQRR